MPGFLNGHPSACLDGGSNSGRSQHAHTAHLCGEWVSAYRWLVISRSLRTFASEAFTIGPTTRRFNDPGRYFVKYPAPPFV
jgi:hypothetical protein